MNPVVGIEVDSSHNNNYNNSSNEIVSIILEIHHYLRSSSLIGTAVQSTSLQQSTMDTDVDDIAVTPTLETLRSRLLSNTTAITTTLSQQIMNTIIPLLFHATNTIGTTTTTTLTDMDVLQIVGFLTSTEVDGTMKQRPLYLITASQVIKREFQKYSCTETATFDGTTTTPCLDDVHVSLEFLQILIHQACTRYEIEVSQNCHDAIVVLFQIPNLPYNIYASTINNIVSIWSNAIATMVDQTNSKIVRDENGTVCVRCTTLLVDIIIVNDRNMELFLADTMASDLLLSLLHNDMQQQQQQRVDDPLVQIAIYDVLYKFVSTRPLHSVRTQYILNDSFLQPLLRQVGVGSESNDNDVLDVYLHGPALQILVAICSTISEASVMAMNHNNHNNVNGRMMGDELIRDLHAAIRNCEASGSEMERLAYIDAISSIASISSKSMNIVLDDPSTCNGWLNLSVAQSKVKAAILVSIAHVLDDPNSMIAHDPTTVSTSRTVTNEMCMKLYSSLGRVNDQSDTTDLLLKLVKSPILEIRLSAYRVFEAIATYSVGGQVLMTNTTFYNDFVLQRNTIEATYEGRIGKYNIVKALYENDSLKQLLSNEIVTKLEQYVSQGPHFKEAMRWDVMTAEQ
jgi:Proteasome non-ATPase 26S subunit